jgi:hypothetical protein
MLCSLCQQFCKDAVHVAKYAWEPSPQKLSKAEGLHETVLHKSINELDIAAQTLCLICRCLWDSLSAKEKASLSDMDCTVTLQMDATDQGKPSLFMLIQDKSGANLLSRRIVAVFNGLLESGKSYMVATPKANTDRRS